MAAHRRTAELPGQFTLVDGETAEQTTVSSDEWLALIKETTESGLPMTDVLRKQRKSAEAGGAVASVPPVGSPPVGPSPVVTGAAGGAASPNGYVMVKFEFPFGGKIKTFYHKVIYNQGALILVYDHSLAGIPYFSPPTVPADGTDGAPQAFAILVDDPAEAAPNVYLAYPTGISYLDGNREYTVLTVESVKRSVE